MSAHTFLPKINKISCEFCFQFRDFLQLYNKLTELCFQHCADNFFNRQLSPEETTCLDRCVNKFSGVNARVMSSYVEFQTEINTRRMKEMETQMQVARDAELAATAATATATTVPTAAATPAENMAIASTILDGTEVTTPVPT